MTLRPDYTRVSRLLSLFLISLIVIAVSAGAATATHAPDTPTTHVHVSVEDNASATVNLVIAYDLESDEDQQAFHSLETDPATQADLTDRYHDRIAAVAADAENTTNRNMTVSPATITFERFNANTTGTVTLSVTWTNLAATTENQLVITEPFASGFTTDHLFILSVPPDYTATSVEPEPTRTSENALIWDANTDLSGFTVIAAPNATSTSTANPTSTQTATPAPTQTEDSTPTPTQPGFGILLTGIALLTFLIGNHLRN